MTFMIDIPSWVLYLGGGFVAGLVLSALAVYLLLRYLFGRILPGLLDEVLKTIWK